MNIAIIAAGGQGTRVGGVRAKQFLEISGTPIIIHTLRRFEECAKVGETIVVVPPGDTEAFQELAAHYGLRKMARTVAGGATRTESVWRGLQSVRNVGVNIVAVHDAVRPFVTPDEIDRTIDEAEKHGAAILAAPAVDTIKEAENRKIVGTLERARLWHAQTPQCFRYDLLRRAYEQAAASAIDATDDSALVERLGATVHIVEGSARNIKITTRQDLALAETLLREFEE